MRHQDRKEDYHGPWENCIAPISVKYQLNQQNKTHRIDNKRLIVFKFKFIKLDNKLNMKWTLKMLNKKSQTKKTIPYNDEVAEYL